MLGNIFINSRDLLKEIPKSEFHIHTTYSDGKNTVEEFVLKALNENYSSICFTEHVDFTTTWFSDYKNEIVKLKEKNKDLGIYYGAEIRAKDYKGNLNADGEILKESEIIMGVVHTIPSKDGLSSYNPKIFTEKELLELEYKATMSVLNNKVVKILGHPMSNYEKIYGEVPEDCYRKIFKKANKRKIAIELNPIYINNFKNFLKLNLEANTLVSLGSNTHSLFEFGKAFEKVRESIE